MRWLFILIITVAFSCKSTRHQATSLQKTPQNNQLQQFPYLINSPTSTRELPENLKEISGLSFDQKGNLFAIQDENGLVFQIHHDSISAIPFRKDGDYEGIEVVGDKIYVVKSSGTVYEISQLGESTQKRIDFNDFLDDEHDVEGLSYDANTHALLLACKSHGGVEEGLRSVFKFDLKLQKVVETPYFNINLKDVLANIKDQASIGQNEAFLDLIADKGDKLTFAPSAIAIHPITNHIYITSSKGKMLLVCNHQGKIIHLLKLNKAIHPQPEGLAFDQEGNLYISNEGKKQNALLHKFEYQSSN